MPTRWWISEHLAFTRTADVDLGHLNPVAYTAQALAVFADHVAEIQDSSGKRLLIENITTQLQVAGDIPESVFMNRLCEQTGLRCIAGRHQPVYQQPQSRL